MGQAILVKRPNIHEYFAADKAMGKAAKAALTAILGEEEEFVFDFGPMEKPSRALALYARGVERGAEMRRNKERAELLRKEAEAIAVAIGAHTEDIEPMLLQGSYEHQMFYGYGIGDIHDPVSGCYDPGYVEEESNKA